MSAEVSAASQGGREGFYFLPPLVPLGSFTGTFDATLLPHLTVEICALVNETCAGPAIATFNSTTSRGSNSIRVDAVEEHYISPDASGAPLT